MNPSNNEPGPLKAVFRSQDWLGGFSKGDLFAWALATFLWVSISGGVFDVDSWTVFWIFSIFVFLTRFECFYYNVRQPEDETDQSAHSRSAEVVIKLENKYNKSF